MSEELKNRHNYANFEQGSWNVGEKHIYYFSLFLIKNLLCTIFVWKKNLVFSDEVSLNISWQVYENFVNKIWTVNTVLPVFTVKATVPLYLRDCFFTFRLSFH